MSTVSIKRALAVAAAAIALTAAAVFLFKFYQQYSLELQLEARLKTEVSLHIVKGASPKAIGELLTQAGAPAQNFSRLARRMKVDDKLRAGRYRFAAGDTMREVLQKIADGGVVVEKFTIVGGQNFADILNSLRADSRFDSSLKKMTMDEIRRRLDIREENLEGWFLPETYYFDAGSSDFDLLARAHRAMKKLLTTAWRQRQDDGLFTSPYEALILASIVEKETWRAAERPTIASVFANRLRRGMRLQADPTVIYGLGGQFDGNLKRAHLRADTPYNTYTRKGLPPSPIASPDKKAILAVLNPPSTQFLYFVATGEGGHYFSKTLREHNNAVNRYQRKK